VDANLIRREMAEKGRREEREIEGGREVVR
jgi:hypothetical protein